jgi:hypothetical protein
MGIQVFKAAKGNHILQPVKLTINRSLQGEQAGRYYGSPVRLPGSKDRYREYDGERIISVPATFAMLVDPETGLPADQVINIHTGEGIIQRTVAGWSEELQKNVSGQVSLAMKESDFEDLNDLDGQSYTVILDAKVTLNALAGHGREGTFWVENLGGLMEVFETAGPNAASTAAEVDASLAKGFEFSATRQQEAFARRQERVKLRPTNLRDKAQVAAEIAAGAKSKLSEGAAKQAEKVAETVGMAPEDIPASGTSGASNP